MTKRTVSVSDTYAHADVRALRSELVAGSIEVLNTQPTVLTEQQVGPQGAAVDHRADEVRARISLVVRRLDERPKPTEEVDNRVGPNLESDAAGEVPKALRTPDQRGMARRRTLIKL
jgi:hypothetical protein